MVIKIFDSNIPLHNMTEAIVRFVAGKIGQCVEVDSDNGGRCWGHFSRARIRFDLMNPLKRRIKVRHGKEALCFWADVKYERLPGFCFLCGRTEHVT